MTFLNTTYLDMVTGELIQDIDGFVQIGPVLDQTRYFKTRYNDPGNRQARLNLTKKQWEYYRFAGCHDTFPIPDKLWAEALATVMYLKLVQ